MVRTVVILDKLVPRRPTRVHTLLVPMLMGQNRSLASKTAAEIQLVLAVNVVRTVVVLDKLVRHRPTPAHILLAQMLTAHNHFKESKIAMETLLAASAVANAAPRLVVMNNCALLPLTRVLIKIALLVLNLSCPNTVFLVLLPVAFVETHNALQDSCAMLNKASVLSQYVLWVLNGIHRIRAVVAAVAVAVAVVVVVSVVDQLFHVFVVVCALKQPMTFIGVAIQKVYQ